MTTASTPRRIWILTAWLVMIQLLWVQAMVASSELHHDCHDHAHEPTHECAVTLMLQGGYDVVLADLKVVTIAQVAPSLAVKAAVTEGVLASHFSGGILAQAPPRGP
jgi:hypothetical protein